MADGQRITAEQELDWRRWGKDPIAFIDEAVQVLNPRGKWVKVEQREYQRDCLRKFITRQVCCVLKARQIGLTTVACCLALWLLLFNEDRFILVLSKNDEDAKKFLRRIKLMYTHLPAWVRERGPSIVGKWGVKQVEFSNGSFIFSATSASDHGRGDTPTDIFLDEIGFMRNPDDAWSALTPAMEEGGNMRIFGTAKGYKSWYHKKWVEWSDDPDIETIFYGWQVMENRDEAWANRLRRRLGEALFRQEYPSTAEEAFVTSGAQVFSVEVLESIERTTITEPLNILPPDYVFEIVEQAKAVDGMGLFVFEEPQAGVKYLLAADPSEGLVDGDPSVFHVLKWEGRQLDQVAVFRSRFEPNDFADAARVVAKWFSGPSLGVWLGVERNNHGYSVLKRLLGRKVPNVIGEQKKPGLWTSDTSKASCIVSAKAMLAEGEIIIRDAVTLDEFYGFQEKRRSSGTVYYEGAGHDDHVDPLCMIAGYVDRQIPLEVVEEEEATTEDRPGGGEAQPFSLDWFRGRVPRGRVY